MKKKKKLSLLQKRALTGFAFITPWLIGFLWFYVKSLIQAVRFSLSRHPSAYTSLLSFCPEESHPY